MSLHLVSKMDSFFYSLLLFNLCTALGGSTAALMPQAEHASTSNIIFNSNIFFKNNLVGFKLPVLCLFNHVHNDLPPPSLPTGPWFVGELIDGHIGACFAFGVFIDGHFLEGSLTYVVGVVQVRKVQFQAICLTAELDR